MRALAAGRNDPFSAGMIAVLPALPGAPHPRRRAVGPPTISTGSEFSGASGSTYFVRDPFYNLKIKDNSRLQRQAEMKFVIGSRDVPPGDGQVGVGNDRSQRWGIRAAQRISTRQDPARQIGRILRCHTTDRAAFAGVMTNELNAVLGANFCNDFVHGAPAHDVRVRSGFAGPGIGRASLNPRRPASYCPVLEPGKAPAIRAGGIP